MFYAHIEIVVTFLVVNFLGFLVIARYPTMRFWRNLVEMFPFSLPELSKPKFSKSNCRKTNILETKILEKPENVNDHFNLSVHPTRRIVSRLSTFFLGFS